MTSRPFFRSLTAIFLLLVCFSADSFASQGWPPPDGEPSYEIIVAAHDWHTFIIVPPFPGETHYLYKEYGFAEHAWYVEGKQGIQGAVRALLLPSPSVVAVRTTGPNPLQNYPVQTSRVWKFRVTEEGLKRMVRHMQKWFHKDELTGIHGTTKFYRGKQPYHLLRTCHHFTAATLKRAGIPIDPSRAFTERLIAAQLDRITKKYGVPDESS